MPARPAICLPLILFSLCLILLVDARVTLGGIIYYAGSTAPPGYLLCDGTLFPVTTYTALYALIGTTYGGDGVTTFAVPDLRTRMPVGVGQGPQSTRTLGEQGGSETVTLLATQMPAHSHAVTFSVASAGAVVTPAPGVALGNAQMYSTATADTAIRGANVGVAGGNQPVQTMPPYLALNAIICTEAAGCDGTCDTARRGLQGSDAGVCSNDTYFLNGTVTIAPPVVSGVPVVIAINVSIDGSLVLVVDSHLALPPSVKVTVSDCATFNGNLTLLLDELPSVPVNLTQIYYGCVSGKFTDIQLSAPNAKACQTPKRIPTYGSASLSVLLVPSDTCNLPAGRSLSTAAIVAIGVCGGIGALAVIVALTALVLIRMRNPYAMALLRRKSRRRQQYADSAVYN